MDYSGLEDILSNGHGNVWIDAVKHIIAYICIIIVIHSNFEICLRDSRQDREEKLPSLFHGPGSPWLTHSFPAAQRSEQQNRRLLGFFWLLSWLFRGVTWFLMISSWWAHNRGFLKWRYPKMDGLERKILSEWVIWVSPRIGNLNSSLGQMQQLCIYFCPWLPSNPPSPQQKPPRNHAWVGDLPWFTHIRDHRLGVFKMNGDAVLHLYIYIYIYTYIYIKQWLARVGIITSNSQTSHTWETGRNSPARKIGWTPSPTAGQQEMATFEGLVYNFLPGFMANIWSIYGKMR